GCAQLESAVNAEKAKIEKEKQEKEAARATQEPSEPKDPRDEKLVKYLTFTDINGKVKSLRELERAAGSQDQIIQDGKVKLTSAMNPNDVICAVSEIERGKLTSRESLKCVSISTTDKQGSARVSMTFISDKSGIMFEVLCGSPKHTSETMTFKALRKEIGSIIEL
ncbi:MAG: hypothetical protein IT289_09420, partial [Oligoflexia bacterium]|nr:hypothetical protein [Oligoflexia bacterium]